MVFILRPLKLFILFIIGSFRRAICCFRINKQSFDQDEVLTHVGVVSNKSGEVVNWNDTWTNEEIHCEKRPQTIQDHIQLYRDRITQPETTTDEDNKVKDLFQELEPQVIQQKRVIIQKSNTAVKPKAPDLSRLAVSNSFTESGLGDWVEEMTTGWDEQLVDPSDILREQKRLQRENRQQTLGGRKLKM